MLTLNGLTIVFLGSMERTSASMNTPIKMVQCFRARIKVILWSILLTKYAICEVPRCSDFLSIERKLYETTMVFEVKANVSETNTFFQVVVFVSHGCQENLCSLRVRGRNSKFRLNTGSPLMLQTKFFNQSKNENVYAILFSSSTECKVLCDSGNDTVALKKHHMKYSYYPKGKRNFQKYPCDYDRLLAGLSTTTTVRSIVEEREEICGTTSAALNSTVGRNMELQKGDWPWLAAIYVTKGAQLRFQCSGVVVSQRAIVMTARCLYDHDHFFSPKEITIFLGKHDLLDFSEVGFTAKSTRDIVIHPSYRPYSYHHDIAILQTNDLIEFTDFIAPACIWGKYPPVDESCKCDVAKLVDWDILSAKNYSWEPSSIMSPITIPHGAEYSVPQSSGGSELLYDIDIRLNVEPDIELCNDKNLGIALILHSGRWILRGTGAYCTKNGVEAFEMHTDISKYLDWIMDKVVE